jgi:hypothetical protein
MLFNQQQCFIYSTASFLSKLRAKKVEKLRQKNLRSVGINYFFSLSAKPEIVVPGSGIRFQYFISEISGKPSFVEAVL